MPRVILGVAVPKLLRVMVVMIMMKHICIHLGLLPCGPPHIEPMSSYNHLCCQIIIVSFSNATNFTILLVLGTCFTDWRRRES